MTWRLAPFAGVLALFIATSANAAAVVATDPPSPIGTSREAIEQWIGDYVVLGQYVASAVTDAEALAFDPTGMELAPDGVRATVRGEMFRAVVLPTGAVRSYRNRVAVNCSGGRMLILSREGFPQSNLQGDSSQIDTTKEAWSQAYPPASPQAALIRQVCSVASLYRDGIDLAQALPPPPDSLADDASRDWIGRNIDPKGERLLYVRDGLGVFLSPTDATRSPEGHPIVWMRRELTALLAADETAMRSMREHTEIDCAGKRVRDLEEEIYPGSNLMGAVYKVGPDAQWTQVPAGSPDLAWLADICAAPDPGKPAQPSSIR